MEVCGRDVLPRVGPRTTMQWTPERHGGFSRAKSVVRPAIDDATYGFRATNVEAPRCDPSSLLNWQERIIRMRQECPEISWGDFVVLRTAEPSVLALCYDWRGTSLMTVHNFSARTVRPQLSPQCHGAELLVDVFDGTRNAARKDGSHRLSLKPHAWHWFRVGDDDNVLARDALDLVQS